MKKIVVLGGGISGLSVAYFLSNRFDVTLIEKREKTGGWLESLRAGGYFFEKGPRTFPVRRSKELIELALDLDLEGELLPMSRVAKKRFLWTGGQLQTFPVRPFSLLARLLLKEWRVRPKIEDETIWVFAERRLGAEAADLVFDPMVKGIFGGDAKKISVEAALPFLKECERKYGSLLKGILKKRRVKWDVPRVLQGSSLFAFRSGVERLVGALEEQLEGALCLGETVKELQMEGEEWRVRTDQRVVKADCVVSALPAFVLGELLQCALKSIPYVGLKLVHLGYATRVLPKEGFGYLIPSREGETVLGVLFDSSLFPAQNQREEETRLTVILPSDCVDVEREALRAVSSHLGILEKPSFVSVSEAPMAIPQYYLGHRELLVRIERELKDAYPSLFLVGSYLWDGVSVNGCIKGSKKCAEKIAEINKDPTVLS